LSGIKKINNLPPEEVVNIWKSNKIDRWKRRQSAKSVRLPEDITNDLQRQAPAEYLWLQLQGITDEEIIKYNICYSGYFGRVIFPVYSEHGDLIYWQGRKIDGDGPKWLNVKQQDREDIYFKAFNEKGRGIVIVEDMISAIIVARVNSSLALLGSYIPDKLVLSLKDRDVYVWLDEDKKNEAVKHYIRLKSHNINVRLRVTKKDPKCYSEDEIKTILVEGGKGG
jgi:DNA primase